MKGTETGTRAPPKAWGVMLETVADPSCMVTKMWERGMSSAPLLGTVAVARHTSSNWPPCRDGSLGGETRMALTPDSPGSRLKRGGSSCIQDRLGMGS